MSTAYWCSCLWPAHIDEYAVINAIGSDKDVDGFTAQNVGNMYLGQDCFIPCTPQGCIDLLEFAGVEISGKDAVVIGRSILWADL